MIDLRLGDCRDLVRQINPDDVKLVVLEPPYNIGFQGYDIWPDNLSDDEYIEMLCEFQRFERIISIDYPEETQKYINAALGSPTHSGVWCYNANTPRRFRLINYYGCKPDYSRIKQPYKNLADKRVRELLASGRQGSDLYEWWADIQQVKNVSDEKTAHPCQVPIALIERILILTTDEGDTVLDPFMGSGTTAEACYNLKRHCIGFEISPYYLSIQQNRIEKAQLQPSFI